MPDSTDVLEISNENSEEPPCKKMGVVQHIVSKNHEYQMYSLCGPAVNRVVLKAAKDYQIRLGLIAERESNSITIPDQKTIAIETFSGPHDSEFWPKAKKYVLSKDYDFYQTIGSKSYCLPEDMARFLGRGASFIENQTVDDIKRHVDDGKLVAVLWNEVLPERQETPEGGHWSLAVGYNKATHTITMVDTSRAERLYDARGNVVTDIPNSKELHWTIRPRYNIAEDYLAKSLHDEAVIDGKTRNYDGAIIVIDLANIDLRQYIVQ